MQDPGRSVAAAGATGKRQGGAAGSRSGRRTKSAMINLTELAVGKKARVVGFSGGMVMQRRLVNLGLRPAQIVEAVGHNPFRGPVVIRVDHTGVAVGHGVALGILVEPL